MMVVFTNHLLVFFNLLFPFIHIRFRHVIKKGISHGL
jgi:hypothetical protein